MYSTLHKILLACLITAISYGMVFAKGNEVSKKSVTKLLSIDEIPQALTDTALTREDIPDPHWKANACIVCHTAQNNASKDNLRRKDISDVCLSCHDAEYDHRYIHPVDVKPLADMLKRMDKSYKKSLGKSSGKISCVTCHDIALQCETSKSTHKQTNPKFFRKGPFESRSQPCYFCHDDKKYQRLNPHDQIDDNGEIKKQKCRICHADSINVLNNAESLDEFTFHAKDSLADMYQG